MWLLVKNKGEVLYWDLRLSAGDSSRGRKHLFSMALDQRSMKGQDFKQSTGQPGNGETAYFGYRQVPADEKAKLVHRHFDSIAAKYDFMNTLLSFGLQNLWKRYAVKALGLKPGDRVMDVCGGTGDLSILAAKAVGPSGRARGGGQGVLFRSPGVYRPDR